MGHYITHDTDFLFRFTMKTPKPKDQVKNKHFRKPLMRTWRLLYEVFQVIIAQVINYLLWALGPSLASNWILKELTLTQGRVKNLEWSLYLAMI